MVRSLYARLLLFQFLLLVLMVGLFWVFATELNLPEPGSLILTGLVMFIVAAVVIGLLLAPIDHVLLAFRHLSMGEDVLPPRLKGTDGLIFNKALEDLRQRLFAEKDALLTDKQPIAKPSPPAAKAEAPGGPSAQILDVLNSLSEGVMVFNQDLKPVVTNTALRQMASVDQAMAGTALLEDDHAAYRHVFHARCFVPDQLQLIEEEMVKHGDRPRTDIVQLESPRQFLRRYSAPLFNDTHDLAGFLVSYQDITHEVEQDRLRQDFIANASHELRTPVTSVKLLLENLVDGAKDDPTVADVFLNDALQEIDRMHDLVNDLLDLAALEAGRHNLQLAEFEVAKVAEEAVTTVAPQAKQREVDLAAEVSPDLKLHADRARLRQVLVNLVANAVKFTPAGGTVRLKAVREGERAVFTISDTGIGIPARDLPHIFDRFFRVTRGRSRLQGGSGLGLTIVKQAIDAHRGEVSVESTEGQGTTIVFSFPLTQTVEA